MEASVMSKHILILTGSPRQGGNSDLMADAFIRGAESAGHQITKIQTAQLKINGCTACECCYSSDGKACAQDDDFNQVARAMEQADAIVFSTPIYWFTFPTYLKAVIDKFYSFLMGEKQLPIRESMLLVCGEMEESSIFDGIINSYSQSISYMNWQDRGCFYVTGVCKKGDILATGSLAQIEEIGRNF